jgi:antitoxin VapB
MVQDGTAMGVLECGRDRQCIDHWGPAPSDSDLLDCSVYPIDISQKTVQLLHINAHTKIERTAAVFKSNRSQAVRIPKDFAFPENTKRVIVRKVGNDLILSPVAFSWTDFFAMGPNPDFPERFPQGEYEVRKSFDP